MNHIDLDVITLKKGKHHRRGRSSVCFMEAVAWFAGKPHSDHPECVSPVLGAFLRRWNDDLDDETRQKLKPYIPRVVGTAGDVAAEERRAWMVTDWMVRVHTPAWLRLAGLTDQADAVAGLVPLTDAASAHAGQPVLAAARAAAWDAAWDAAAAAAWDAASAAAAAAARAAARDAAAAAARAAASAAAAAAARAAAWDAARAAAAAAARDAAWDALQPTVESLQTSAFRLLDDLIAVGSEVPA